MITFLNFNFLFFILFFPYFFSSIFPSSFYPSCFLLHTFTLTLFFSFSFFPLFSLPLPPNSRTFHKALFFSLSFSFFFYFFLSLFSLITSSTSFFPSIPSKHTNLKVTHNHIIWFSSNEDRERGEIAKGGKSPLSFADLLCLHRRLSSFPLLLDIFPTANDMW